MSAELHRILSAHVALGYAGERYFILTRVGRDQPLGYSTLQAWAEAAFTAVGIQYGRKNDGITIHSLRHTFASWMAQKDVQLSKIGMLMRDTVETVSRTYIHLVPDDLKGPVELVGRIATGEAE